MRGKRRSRRADLGEHTAADSFVIAAAEAGYLPRLHGFNHRARDGDLPSCRAKASNVGDAS
jgi:hypothetical protein